MGIADITVSSRSRLRAGESELIPKRWESKLLSPVLRPMLLLILAFGLLPILLLADNFVSI